MLELKNKLTHFGIEPLVRDLNSSQGTNVQVQVGESYRWDHHYKDNLCSSRAV